jgi:hypothetical protein
MKPERIKAREKVKAGADGARASASVGARSTFG